jgi:hypothetical protein
MTLFTIVLSNHDYNEIVGSPNAPYINSLIAQYGLATNYMDSGVHPALPNYLYMVSGSTQGVTSDLNPTQAPFPVSGDNLGRQFNQAFIAWRSYQESAGTGCNLSPGGAYLPEHDPFLYFSTIQANAPICAALNLDYSKSFATDLGASSFSYAFITPNLTDDGHDPSATPADIVQALQQSDTWLLTEVPKILASSAWQNGGVLFITWDQAEGRNGDSPDQVPMIVVTKGIKSPGYKSSVPYDHASFLATVEDIFGLPRLGAAVGKTPMTEFWQ